ncbi:MAG: MMPL family transporter, partial [Acidimicrobiales bacterium]
DPLFGPSQVQTSPTAADLMLISVPVNGDIQSRAATNAIGTIRSEVIPAAFPDGVPAEVLVGGQTAFNKDFFELTDRYMPIVFVFVLGLSFVLLTVAFRSIVVPIKAILLNLLSVSAAYGLIVLVSQKGVGADILGFQQVEAIEAWLPLFLFCVLFGLSMDYHVFLLSRIREHYDQTGDNTESVAFGLRTTAGIITGAALIMVAVFGGFASGQMVMFQQMGFGLAVAVLIDATIVRTILVPSSMKLLGRRNWYLPKWLEWLPHMEVEGPHTRSTDELVPEPVGVGGGPATSV